MARTDHIYDIAIIGGGINGAGIARDAAGRGYSVFLGEKGDLAGGTSSGSTKLIHGGLRYLEHYAFRLVREALTEREALLGIAPHVVRPLRFVLPVGAGSRPAWMLRAGLLLYDHLGGRRQLPGTRSLDLTRDDVGAALKPGFTRAFEYSDCWVDDARLVVLNAMDAARLGAEIATRTRFISARAKAGRWRAQIEDMESGRRREIAARLLVNAAGPWADSVQRDVLGDNGAGSVRLVQGSHLVVDRLFEHDRSYIFQNQDGRVLFAIPYEERFTLLGTTEVEFSGDPGTALMSADEGDYILAAANRYFRRQLTRDDIRWAYAAVRPLVDGGAGPAQAESRDYAIRLERRGGAPLVSVAGGKITTYRRLAESVLGRADEALGRKTTSWTAQECLPGGNFGGRSVVNEIGRLASRYPFLAQADCRRLVQSYGTLAADILGDARAKADLGEDFGGGLTTREVCHLSATEWARTADDILWRRSKLGLRLGPAQRERLEAFLADGVTACQ